MEIAEKQKGADGRGRQERDDKTSKVTLEQDRKIDEYGDSRQTKRRRRKRKTGGGRETIDTHITKRHKT